MIDLSGIPILSAIIFGPLIGALVIAFLPRREGSSSAGQR
jgi:hypothetical protein